MAHYSLPKDVTTTIKTCSPSCGISTPRYICPRPSTRIAREYFARGYRQSVRSLSESFFRLTNSHDDCRLPTPLDHRALMPRYFCGGSQEGEVRKKRTKPKRVAVEQNDTIDIPEHICGYPSTRTARQRFKSSKVPNVHVLKSNFAKTMGAVCESLAPDKSGTVCDFLRCRGACGGQRLCCENTNELSTRNMSVGVSGGIYESQPFCKDNRNKCVWGDSQEIRKCDLCNVSVRKPCSKNVSWEDLKTPILDNYSRSQCDCHAVGDSLTDESEFTCKLSDSCSDSQYIESSRKCMSSLLRPYQDQNYSKSNGHYEGHDAFNLLHPGVTFGERQKRTHLSGILQRQITQNHPFKYYKGETHFGRSRKLDTSPHRKLPCQSSSRSSHIQTTNDFRGNSSAPNVFLRDTLYFRNGR